MENSGFIKYSHLYEKEPESRVFAPLAETYRKLGMLKESFDILRKGIQVHPDYVLGYIVLARCHRDMGEFQRAYEVLQSVPFVEKDNFSYKFLRADLAYKLDEAEDALTLYRELLWLNPSGNYGHRIAVLEDKLKGEAPMYSRLDTKEVTDLQVLEESGQWVSVDFSETTGSEEGQELSSDMMTHTLIKLYSDQGHYAKALQIANAFLEEEPDNLEVKEMRDEIIEKRLFEKETVAFEEDDELSDDHIEEGKRSFEENLTTKEESLLLPYLQKFQERINLKSAQVKLSFYE